MAIYKNKKKYVAIRCIVYCVFLITVDGFDYNIATQRSLCRAQCRARQLAGLTDNAACNSESLTWITHCDAPNCVGTCSIFFADHLNHTEDAVRVPDIHLSLVGNRDVELVWLPAITSRHTLSPSHVIYVIEETLPDYVYGGLSTTVLVNSTSATSFQTPLHGLCYPAQYRVMAVNRYGSAGFTHHVVTPAIPPGPVQNLQLTGAGIYYYEDKLEQDFSSFMTVIKWDPPAGWMERDIDHYEWNPMIKRWCDDIGHDTFPTFQEMVNQTNHILMTINSGSIGCKFETQIRAVSKCNITGPWTDLPVDLTNCSSINGFRCNDKPVSPPGLVKNVSLSVTSASREEVMKYYADPGLNLTCPLFVYLHIKWRPPPDMGSRGVIDKYIIRSGRTKREFLPIPPSFIETPTTKEAPNDTIEIIFELPSHTIPYTFAVQVVALGPGQLISDNEWGLFPMYTMEVSRNESGIASLIQEGKVLLDKAGIVIVYINNFRHAQFMFDQPMGKSENITFERYAMQWGPLVGPDGNQTMMVENETVVGRNQCMLGVHLAHPGKRYGLQVRHLLDIEEDDEQSALESEFFTFELPGENETALGPSKQNAQMTPAWVTLVTVASVLVGIAISTVTLRHLHKQHRFKHLERRLIATEEHVDEEGVHYFVFRPVETRATDADTTVVADRWELPHHCLKIGQLLGSGAFGRVVKGRVSKSLLTHRGTDVFMAQQQTGPYLTVAIKIIQENSEEKYIQDFLNEIQMMKDIGYHRNIVSLLGCCTLRQPYCLVVEHLPNGDLLAYLRKLRQEIKQHESITDGYVNQDFEIFTPADLMSVAQQVASGMDFLNQKGFVHRDLAARNVLVGENKNVKIADFGLARYIYHDVNKIYVHRRGGKLPLRWMAPEAIFNLVFSPASDVWSFGILLYEIVSLGGSPYPSWSNADLLKYLKQGIRMERPDNCSLDV
ncbi:hypothetical protein DPMN_095992 [Dreissena polymorpha]|uniref:Protein kinase domain-containing protein n=2 Tax=Dreissena polymorpha TaxID=45954 RepID=A0A9D4R435_DREPO|nr:hypothetical protein DPMN_095992 [Dreissena polymorpha]